MVSEDINRYCACCGVPTKSPVYEEDSDRKRWTYCTETCAEFHQSEVLCA